MNDDCSHYSHIIHHHLPTQADHGPLSCHIYQPLHYHSIPARNSSTYTMLRSFPRAAPSSSSIRGPSIRTALRNPRTTVPLCTSDAKRQQTRSIAAHAISNPTLSQIEKRWEGMPPQEQADLWMKLRDRMKNDWHELTLQERKAGTSAYSSFFAGITKPRRSACVLVSYIYPT